MTIFNGNNIAKIMILAPLLMILLLPIQTQYVNHSEIPAQIQQINRIDSNSNIDSDVVASAPSTRLGVNALPLVTDCGGVAGMIIEGNSLVNTSMYVLNCPQSIVRENIINSVININNDSIGIKVFNSPGSLIRGNEIYDIYSNNFVNASVGILLIESDDTIIEKNTIFNVTGTSSTIINFPLTNGIFVDNSSNVTISNNEILSVNGGYVNGIYANGTGEIVVDNNLIDSINGISGITAGILIETYDYAELTSNTITNLNTINSISSLRIHMTIGISTFMVYGNKHVQKTLIQANTLENITIINNIGSVDLLGIGSFSNEDTINQNTITNLTIVGEPNVDGLLGAVASLSPTFINGNSTITDNTVSNLYIGDTLSNGSMFGFYTSNRYSVNIRNNQLINVNNSAFFAGPGQTSLYYQDTILNLNFTDNSASQITSSYPVSEIYLKISENYGADQYSLNFEFQTINRLGLVLKQPLIVGYDSYKIIRDGTSIETGVYDSSQVLGITSSGLLVGNYQYTLNYLDTIGNNPAFSYSFNFIVNPSISLVIDDLNNIIIEQGSDHTFQWNVVTSVSFNYQIQINGTEFVNIVNFVDTLISFELPVILGVGSHNITIIVDNQDLIISDTFFVFIIDTTSPTITQLDDINLDESITNITLSWETYDFNPSNYSIFITNQSVIIGDWENAVNITVELLNLTSGNYEIEIVVHDLYGNEVTDNFNLIIGDFSSPTISNPGDVFMNEGEVGRYITWVVKDNHPASFTIGVNGITVINNTWYGEVWISFDLDGLEWGFYNVSLTLTDLSGNEVTDWVFIRVYNQLITSTESEDVSPSLFGIVDTTILAGAGIVIAVAGVGYGITRRRG